MKENVNLVRTDQLRYRVKMFFVDLFGIRIRKISAVEDIARIGKLLKTKKVSPGELTKCQQHETLIFLENEISSKEVILQDLKSEKLYKQIKSCNDIVTMLKATTSIEKLKLIGFLKKQVGEKTIELEMLKYPYI